MPGLGLITHGGIQGGMWHHRRASMCSGEAFREGPVAIRCTDLKPTISSSCVFQSLVFSFLSLAGVILLRGDP